jgi:DNA-directed RNA polymerase specialized sigma24 family protein
LLEEIRVSAAGSVSCWIAQLKAGDRAAAQPLFEKYFQQLVQRARQHIGRHTRRAADEEDAALSALDSFCRAAERGRYPLLHDRTDLWQLLLVITEQKARDLIRHERSAKRGGGKVLGERDLFAPDSVGAAIGLDQVQAREPSPALAAQAAEEFRRLLDRLEDPELRSVALWKMEGYEVAEIAAKLGCASRTIKRRLRLIRAIWKQEIRP